jgi:hypothetical protein
MEKNFIKTSDNALINICFIKVIEKIGGIADPSENNGCFKLCALSRSDCNNLGCYGTNVRYVCKKDSPEAYGQLLDLYLKVQNSI